MRLDNSLAYSFIVFGILILLTFGINAYNLGGATYNGHTMDELAPPAGCPDYSSLKWDNTNNVWKCVGAPVRNGVAGYIPRFYDAGSLENSEMYEAGNNVGIGRTDPRSKLDVAGDIKASGPICDKNGCVGGFGEGQWIVSNEYVLKGDDIYDDLFMDEHFFCFLVQVTMSDPVSAGNYACKVEYSNAHWDPEETGWVLRIDSSGISSDICKARCIN